jgi:threonine dehydratase
MTGQTQIGRVTLEDVREAQEAILGFVHRTPIFGSETLSDMTGTELRLKAESLQKTGSFKVRGAIFAAKSLNTAERSRGVICVTAGNHGAALAYGAAVSGIHATILMPSTAVQTKIEAVKGYGGEVILVEPNRLLDRLEEIQQERGSIYVNPIGSRWMVAGSGTVGTEILEDLLDPPDAVVVPVGGGGLIAGIAVAVKALSPGTRVIGVEPETADVVTRSLAAGEPVRIDYPTSVADGLNTPFSAPLSLDIIQRLVDGIVTISDAEIVYGMRLILERMKLVVEPAGAAAVSALLAGKIPGVAGKRVVVILSGGNVDVARMGEILAAAQ